jgi:hypothetical protein
MYQHPGVDLLLQKYVKLHGDIVAGVKPPRFIVFYCPPVPGAYCGGFTDRLRGLVFVIALGILMDRAVLIDWKFPLDVGSTFFRLSPLDYSYPPSVLRQAGGRDSVVEWEDYNKFNSIVTNLEKLGVPEEVRSHKVIRMRTNLFGLAPLFRNPSFKQKLVDHGITDTDMAFGYLVRNLLVPPPEVAAAVNSALALAGPRTLVVLQLRLGRYDDRAMTRRTDTPIEPYTVPSVERHMSCLKTLLRDKLQLKEGRLGRDERVVYMVALDTPDQRDSVLRQLGGRENVVEIPGEVRHVDKNLDFNEDHWWKVAYDWWLAGEADAAVVTPNSGFIHFALHRRPVLVTQIYPVQDKEECGDLTGKIWKDYVEPGFI